MFLRGHDVGSITTSFDHVPTCDYAKGDAHQGSRGGHMPYYAFAD